MGNFTGVIIEESLADTAVLHKVTILKTKVERVTPRHNTPYLKQWTLHTVAIAASEVDTVAKLLSESFDREHSDWYADFKNEAVHVIVFPHRIFKVLLSQPEGYAKVVEYGMGLGIPGYQLNFTGG